MKKISMTLLLSTLFASNVFAENVHLPFIHKAVPDEGLTISYHTKRTQKVVCITENFYKGSLTVTVNGRERDTDIFFGNYDEHEFYFTNVGQDLSFDDLDQVNVDKTGYIQLKDTHFKPHQAYASCFYIPETLTQASK